MKPSLRSSKLRARRKEAKEGRNRRNRKFRNSLRRRNRASPNHKLKMEMPNR
jgi:hypothetical protein